MGNPRLHLTSFSLCPASETLSKKWVGSHGAHLVSPFSGDTVPHCLGSTVWKLFLHGISLVPVSPSLARRGISPCNFEWFLILLQFVRWWSVCFLKLIVYCSLPYLLCCSPILLLSPPQIDLYSCSCFCFSPNATSSWKHTSFSLSYTLLSPSTLPYFKGSCLLLFFSSFLCLLTYSTLHLDKEVLVLFNGNLQGQKQWTQ